ncbi:MAG: CheR family methyltransferase [Eggerthellaceae bacterium]
MTDSEFEQVRSFLAQTYGLDMDSKRTLLECRLARERDRLQLPSFSAYFDLVESGRNQQERNRFVNLVTTHYTYFLRESAQFKFLFATAFPELLAKRPNRPWNILCAGCSTGEECYSVSMLVRTTREPTRSPPFASPASTCRNLRSKRRVRPPIPNRASTGCPVAGAMRTSFRNGQLYTVAERIRSRVFLAQGNLCDDEVLRRTYDLIMCRNVIIYLKAEVRNRVIATLHATSPHRATSCWGTPRSSANVRCSNTRGTPFIEDKRKRPTYEHETEQHQHKPHLDDIYGIVIALFALSIAVALYASTRTPP